MYRCCCKKVISNQGYTPNRFPPGTTPEVIIITEKFFDYDGIPKTIAAQAVQKSKIQVETAKPETRATRVTRKTNQQAQEATKEEIDHVIRLPSLQV
ncbi:unnamed protein product [Gongylonema pulchrum]|uniref:Uncharacterized protein n=1 Tax=Gongylonema pulchrum TaxID=637853 RepID=A0A183ERZ9_9BILA|nr:unnamed protein product [Gongylonema pulchrum]